MDHHPHHIGLDQVAEDLVCKACGMRQPWQSDPSAPLFEILFRAAQFAEAHGRCGDRYRLLMRRQAQAAAAPAETVP